MPDLSTTRIALILSDDLFVRSWQFRALEECTRRGATISTVAVCRNDRSSHSFRHMAYYALAAVTAKRLEANRVVNVAPLLDPSTDCFEFESVWEGAWQRIPDQALVRFTGADVAVKFGMNLLRDPDQVPCRLGVLSFHHGDPERYRGRPAGYYELSDGARSQGIIVQRLSNVLDGGVVLASARIPVTQHSYKKTLGFAYAASTHLLWRALDNAQQDSGYSPREHGTNFRLPTNGRVLLDGARLMHRKLRRIAYGAFQEKAWRVYRMDAPRQLGGVTKLRVEGLTSLPIPEGFTFAADPFVSRQGAVYCELLDGRSGKGRIGVFRDNAWRFVDMPERFGHVSYPFVVEDAGRVYLLPEVASHTSPTLLQMSQDGTHVVRQTRLQGLENERLVDCTLHRNDGHWYLFGSPREESLFRLDLWVSANLTGPYCRHPRSPICLDARSARMAGPIITSGTEQLRPGQDCTVDYGGSLTVSRIDTLRPNEYTETQVGGVYVSDARGPHTMSILGETAWIDAYTVRASPLAGVRRIKAHLSFAQKSRFRSERG